MTRADKPIGATKIIITGSGGINELKESGYTVADNGITSTTILLEKGREKVLVLFLPALDDSSLFPNKKEDSFLPDVSFLQLDIIKKL